MDSTAITILRSSNESWNPKMIQKFRDVFKTATVMTNDTATFVLLGLENQSQISYCMPPRCYMYDAAAYNDQCAAIASEHAEHNDLSGDERICMFAKTDKLKPMITLVINWSKRAWDGPRSLHEMMGCTDPDVLAAVPDYKINLLDPYELSDNELESFKSELMPVLSLVKYRRDKKKRKEIMEKYPERFKVSKLAVDVMNEVAKAKIPYGKDEEMIDVGEKFVGLYDSMMEEAREEALEKARKEVRGEVREEVHEEVRKEKETMISRMAKKMSPKEIAEIVDKSVEYIQSILKTRKTADA